MLDYIISLLLLVGFPLNRLSLFSLGVFAMVYGLIQVASKFCFDSFVLHTYSAALLERYVGINTSLRDTFLPQQTINLLSINFEVVAKELNVIMFE